MGQQVIELLPDSSNKLLRRWQGPGTVVQVKSPYSYLIKLEQGQRRWLHANKLRPYHRRVNEVVINNCAIIYDTGEDFGTLPVAETVQNANCVHNPLPSVRVYPAKLRHLCPAKNNSFYLCWTNLLMC